MGKGYIAATPTDTGFFVDEDEAIEACERSNGAQKSQGKKAEAQVFPVLDLDGKTTLGYAVAGSANYAYAAFGRTRCIVPLPGRGGRGSAAAVAAANEKAIAEKARADALEARILKMEADAKEAREEARKVGRKGKGKPDAAPVESAPEGTGEASPVESTPQS